MLSRCHHLVRGGELNANCDRCSLVGCSARVGLKNLQQPISEHHLHVCCHILLPCSENGAFSCDERRACGRENARRRSAAARFNRFVGRLFIYFRLGRTFSPIYINYLFAARALPCLCVNPLTVCALFCVTNSSVLMMRARSGIASPNSQFSQRTFIIRGS